MIPWGKIDHHKLTQLEHIKYGLIDMLDSLQPSLSLSLLFPSSLVPYLPYFCPSFFPLPSVLLSFLPPPSSFSLPFHFLACFLACLLSCLLLKTFIILFFPMSSSSRDLPAWLSIAPWLPLMFSLWSNCGTWTGTRITFGVDKTMKKEQEIWTPSWHLLYMA